MQAEDNEWGYCADQEAVGDRMEERFFEKSFGPLRLGVSKSLADN